MNISAYEFQVIFCALILLSLAAVALVVDYLKGMNEKLRERHIDLMARHDTVVQQVEQDNTRLLRALAEQSKAFREMHQRSIMVQPKPVETAAPKVADQPAPTQAAADVAPLPQQPAEQTPVAESDLPSNVVRIRLKQTSPASQEQIPPQPETASPNFDKFLEDLVTEFEETSEAFNRSAIGDISTPATSLDGPFGTLEVPVGLHPVAVLNQLLESKDYFFGLALSIGINDYLKLEESHGHAASEQLLNTVEALMGELAGETGFCSRRSDDEFVLIFPLLNGPAAQQKVAAISEQLWDYQLEALGTFTAVFSWGACEAKRLTLSTVLHNATENMIETKGTRASSDSGVKQRATA